MKKSFSPSLRLLVAAVPALVLALAAPPALANNVAYISAGNGYVLHNNGGMAVTANWDGQAPLQGFSGYGRIQTGGLCLGGSLSGQPLRWEACRDGDKSQIWGLKGQKLNNELGWCADVEGGGGAGARVLAYGCHGGGNQKWRAHVAESAQSMAARISNPQARATFVRNAASARPGTAISLSTGEPVVIRGNPVVSAGGGNVIAAGGGNVVSAGGGN